MGKLFSYTKRGRTGQLRRGISKAGYGAGLAAVALVAFVAGTRSDQILQTVGPTLGFGSADTSIDLSDVEAAYRKLAANYDGTLDKNQLIDGAAEGLVAAAGDPYTVYLDEKEARKFADDLSGKVGGGIGAEIGLRNGRAVIVRILTGNPAERVGLKAGDVIERINDEAASTLSPEDAARKIRGEIGTTVRLTVKRSEEVREFNITRAEINNPSVYSRVEDGIGIMTITRFDGQTANLARQVASGFTSQRARGVVLDLRDNGGGYLDAAQDVAGLWLDDKVVVTERRNGKVVNTLRSGTSPVLSGVKTVVLINGGSASASEIVAGALKDNGAATLIGEKSFGKGTVQNIVDLPDGARLKVTIGRWYTPAGKNITKEGIMPDSKVEQTTEDVNAGRDPQGEAAKRAVSG